MTATNSWGMLLRQTAQMELSRLESSSKDQALRKALANKRQSRGPAGWDPLATPCPWWCATDAHAHATWLADPVPEALPWEELDPCKQWAAGQPVLLRTGGHEHVGWLRLVGFTFTPRWLAGSIRERRVSPVELTTRNPREVWRDPFELQLAQALLSAGGDTRCAWLRDVDEETEPELHDLLLLAQEELAWRPTPTTGPEPIPSPAPEPRRAWTRSQIEALRLPEGTVEPVDLAPGR